MEHILNILGNLVVIQKVKLKNHHTRDTKNVSHSRHEKCIILETREIYQLRILRKDHTQEVLLSLKRLNRGQLRISF